MSMLLEPPIDLRGELSKADALASSSGWPFGVSEESPTTSRLLVLRDTARNRDVTSLFGATLRASYPGDPWQARAALFGDASWPGASVLWAAERADNRIEIAARARQPRSGASAA